MPENWLFASVNILISWVLRQTITSGSSLTNIFAFEFQALLANFWLIFDFRNQKNCRHVDFLNGIWNPPQDLCSKSVKILRKRSVWPCQDEVSNFLSTTRGAPKKPLMSRRSTPSPFKSSRSASAALDQKLLSRIVILIMTETILELLQECDFCLLVTQRRFFE